MRQPRLFISSSLADQLFAKRLADYLYRAYDEVWFDANRYGGEVWWEDVLWNIKASDIFIYLLSPSSLEVAYCRAEYAEARRLRKQLLPVVIRPHTPVPQELAELQPIDLSQGLTASKVSELLSALKRLESQFPKAPPVPVNSGRTPAPEVMPESPPERRSRRTLVLLAVLIAFLGLALFVVATSSDPSPPKATRTSRVTDTVIVPTSTPVAPTVTIEVLPTTVERPSQTPTATPTATMTDTSVPMTATSRSTVPPTVTRRYSATPTIS